MSLDCATVNQYHNAILQLNDVLSLFTTGSNTTALPSDAIIAAGVIGGLTVAAYCLVVVIVVGVLRHHINKRVVIVRDEDRRGWCMCACFVHVNVEVITL